MCFFWPVSRSHVRFQECFLQPLPRRLKLKPMPKRLPSTWLGVKLVPPSSPSTTARRIDMTIVGLIYHNNFLILLKDLGGSNTFYIIVSSCFGWFMLTPTLWGWSRLTTILVLGCDMLNPVTRKLQMENPRKTYGWSRARKGIPFVGYEGSPSDEELEARSRHFPMIESPELCHLLEVRCWYVLSYGKLT